MESEYLEAISMLKKHHKVEREVHDWLGLPITFFKAGGREEPPVVVSAGAIGVEPAGVYAALELVMQVDVERTVYIVPSRDPTGFHGADFVLGRMLGSEVKVTSSGDLHTIMTTRGAQILVESEQFTLPVLKGVGIACSKGLTAIETLSILREKLAAENIAELLEETRILIPSQMPDIEGVGAFGRFITTMIKEGKLVTYDSLDAPCVPETEVLKSFLEERDIGMCLDLHEDSRCEGFYVLASEEPLGAEETIIDLVLDQVTRYGMEIASSKELEKIGFVSPRDGVAVKKGACGLIDYAIERAYSFAFVTPLRKPLERRVRTLLTACLSALNAYAIAGL